MKYVDPSLYAMVQRVTAPASGLPEQHRGYGVGQGARGGNCLFKKWHLPLHSSQHNSLCFPGCLEL